MNKICNVHIISKDKSISKWEVDRFVDLMYHGSFSNRDAWGYYAKDKLFKKEGAFSELKSAQTSKLTKGLASLKTNFIIGHNRFTTSGALSSENGNNHPFEGDNFVIVHNGVLDNNKSIKKHFKFDYPEQTDSRVILELVEHFYKKKKDELEAVKNTAETIGGSFSVLVHSKATGKTYYFKEKSTNFYWFLVDDELLIGSTSEDNVEYAYKTYEMIFEDKLYDRILTKEAEEERIYEINGKSIEVVEHFKEEEQWDEGADTYNFGYDHDDEEKEKNIGCSMCSKSKPEEEIEFTSDREDLLGLSRNFISIANSVGDLDFNFTDRRFKVCTVYFKLKCLNKKEKEAFNYIAQPSKEKRKKKYYELWFNSETMEGAVKSWQMIKGSENAKSEDEALAQLMDANMSDEDIKKGIREEEEEYYKQYT